MKMAKLMEHGFSQRARAGMPALTYLTLAHCGFGFPQSAQFLFLRSSRLMSSFNIRFAVVWSMMVMAGSTETYDQVIFRQTRAPPLSFSLRPPLATSGSDACFYDTAL
jgi:hypothetical protein